MIDIVAASLSPIIDIGRIVFESVYFVNCVCLSGQLRTKKCFQTDDHFQFPGTRGKYIEVLGEAVPFDACESRDLRRRGPNMKARN